MDLEKYKADVGKVLVGKLFSPWSDIWEKESVSKQMAEGAFNEMSRRDGFFDSVTPYKEIVARSLPVSQSSASNETLESDDTPKKAKGTHGRSGSSRSPSSFSGDSTQGGKPPRPPRSVSSAAPFDALASGNSVTSLQSGKSSLSGNSMASARSQSMEFPGFGGEKPSSRARLIPNPETTKGFKYYSVISQAVLGFRSRDADRLEKVAKALAESKYNFLRANHKHGEYYDHKPCWILVPACPLDQVRKWQPGDTYPVLAVACGCSDTGVEEAYQMMCPNMYSDHSEDKGYLKRAKCTKKPFDNATTNLRKMTLAMAETLVGENFTVKLDQSILRMANLDDDDRNYILNKLQGKTEKHKAVDDKKSEGEIDDEKSGKDDERSNKTFHPLDFDKVQFEETRKSLNSSIQLPKPKTGLDFESTELLLFEVDPESGIDLYPDPMLLLIKAAVNWSWCCGQKLLPACGRANEEEVDLVTPSTPLPSAIEFISVPVTLDEDDE